MARVFFASSPGQPQHNYNCLQLEFNMEIIFTFHDDKRECRYLMSGFKVRITYIIVGIFGLSLAFAPAKAQRPKGNIRSYSESYYTVHEQYGKVHKETRLQDSTFHDQYVTFDDKGNVVQSTHYNPDGSVFCTFHSSTDYEDNNFESTFVRVDPGVIFDREPFCVESVHFSWGEMYSMTYKNDEKGRPVEETIIDLWGRKLYEITIKRDEKGNITEEKFSDGTVNQYKYDNKDNRTEWINHLSNSNVIITTYKYDSRGNVTEMEVNNFFKSTYNFHYDQYSFKYIFDKNGNWKERTEYENGQPIRIAARTIEYSH